MRRVSLHALSSHLVEAERMVEANSLHLLISDHQLSREAIHYPHAFAQRSKHRVIFLFLPDVGERPPIL